MANSRCSINVCQIELIAYLALDCPPFFPSPSSPTSIHQVHLTYEIYFSDLLNFFSRYLADVLLGIFTMESSLL